MTHFASPDFWEQLHQRNFFPSPAALRYLSGVDLSLKGRGENPLSPRETLSASHALLAAGSALAKEEGRG